MSSVVTPPVITRRNTFSSLSAASPPPPPSQQRVSSFPTAAPPPRFDLDFDFDFGYLKSADYTSLRDLLPPSEQGAPSPTAARTFSGGREAVPAKNCLRRRKAEGGGGDCLRRLWVGLVVEPVRACVRFFNLMVLPGISRFAVWIRR